jgi:ribosomal 30S subunit maturation factor RimM
MRPASLEVGYVAGVHGLQGELSIRTHDPSSDVLSRVSRVTLVSPENTWIEFGAVIGQDTVLEPFTWIGAEANIPARSRVAAGTTVR